MIFKAYTLEEFGKGTISSNDKFLCVKDACMNFGAKNFYLSYQQGTNEIRMFKEKSCMLL